MPRSGIFCSGICAAPRLSDRELTIVPSTIDPSRDLLFGLLALQNGLIDQVQLVAAFQAWTRDKGRPMADHLVDRGDLDADDRDVVAALVARYHKKHGGDPEKSLAAINTGRSTRESLARLGDVDIDASVAHLGVNATSTQDGEDADRTASYAVGTATSDGQRFRLLRPHARGGLGAVFVALDAELNREVALKQILDHHADDPMSRQRFVIEAEVTGGLEHPGIVPVYGLGTYGDGRPYYAMRFIRGDSLKEAIDRFHADESLKHAQGRRTLELRKLLRRFLDVCNAIEYAHSRGVLHRDIKPANIILGKHGETLVVDWGLAKVLGRSDPGSAERTLIPKSSTSGSPETLPGSALGTPAYMSPEQAQGDLEHLGPRCDVFSLGATLYVLLTGQTPLEGDDIGAVLRAAQEGAFPPPRKHDPSIDKALEAVCLKAMALAPEDRYATARALADDLERWMADEPVSSWREPWSRSLVRWLTRHRTGVTAVGAALLMAVAGLAAVLGVQTRANAQLTAKNGQLDASVKREAERFNLALDAIKLFHGEVSEDLLLKEKQFGKLRGKLLHGAADFYGKLQMLLEDQKDNASRAALGRAYAELGTLTSQIGSKSEALALQRRAAAVRRELAAQPGANAETVLDLSRGLIDSAYLERVTGDLATATESLKEARKRAEELEANGRRSDAARFVLARALGAQFDMLASSKPAEAIELIDRAKAILQALVDANPGVDDFQKLLAGSLASQAILSSNPVESLAAYARALAIFERLANAKPDVFEFQDLQARIHSAIANRLTELGRSSEGLESRRRAIAIWQRVADANAAVTTLQNNVGYGLNNIGGLLLELGRPGEAFAAHRQAKAIFQKLVDADSSSVAFKSNLANSHGFIGWLLYRTGDPAQALAELEQESTIRNELARSGGAGTRNRLAICETKKAAVQAALGQPGEARTSCDRAISIREDLVNANQANTDYRSGLAESLVRSGQVRWLANDAVGAAADWRRAVGLYEGLPPRSGEDAILEACCHAMLSGLAGLSGSGMTASDGALEAQRAMDILRRAVAAGYRGRALLTEPALNLLRARSDFQLLMMDVAFPAEPFVP
jgi:eukaryotic-like serine/threonine-protein kinase